jgi:TetR/AcrR family transcriptional repressor of nem operon
MIVVRPQSKMKLLDAAAGVVRAKGYTAARVEDVCAAASVTKGSFFHHFASKEDLTLAAVARWDEVSSAWFEAAPYHAHPDPLDRVLGYIDFRKAFLKGELADFTCFAGTMVQEVYVTHPAIRDACWSSFTSHVSTLEPDIEAAMRECAYVGDWTASSLAFHILSVVQGAFILAKAENGTHVATQCLDHLSLYVKMLFGRA